MPGLSSVLRTLTTSCSPRFTGAACHRHHHRHRQRCKIPRRSSSSSSSLSYEWIADGQVIPSHRNSEARKSYGDREVIIFLHGLLGNAKNLRTPAKRLTERLPHLSALCLDVRGHGRSNDSDDAKRFFSPPHDFQSCARDVFDALRSLDLLRDRSPAAICGHSLGGRIALQYSHDLLTMRPSSSEGIRPPKQTWILDSVPGGRVHPSVRNVVEAVSSVPLPVASKSGLAAMLMEQHGLDEGTAAWMASNLTPVRDGAGFEWKFDLSIAKELISNFTHQDFHSMVERVVADPAGEVHLVMAGKNAEWTTDVVDGLRKIQSSSRSGERFRMHTLEKAGHWVHVDDLEGLMELMVEALRR